MSASEGKLYFILFLFCKLYAIYKIIKKNKSQGNMHIFQNVIPNHLNDKRKILSFIWIASFHILGIYVYINMYLFISKYIEREREEYSLREWKIFALLFSSQNP